MSERTRTWHTPAAEPARVQDPAMAALFRALRRAVAMGLDTERSRRLLIAAIDKHCGAQGEASPP